MLPFMDLCMPANERFLVPRLASLICVAPQPSSCSAAGLKGGRGSNGCCLCGGGEATATAVPVTTPTSAAAAAQAAVGKTDNMV